MDLFLLKLRTLACISLFFSGISAESASSYRLGVVIVVDQFRADYLMRFEKEFKAAVGGVGGYQFLMEKGAYFPLADHGLFQNMTGPGHAAILSGSYPYRNHIPMNYWFNREKSHGEYCVQDDQAPLIGSAGVVKNGEHGVSPKNFNADTVGDELKNVDRASRVVSISLKDRAAILLGGKRADFAFWFEDQTCQWVTSQFYAKELPAFVKTQNQIVKSGLGQKINFGDMKNIEKCSRESYRTPWGMDETFKFASAAVKNLKLGRGKDTDLLTLSLSSHDYAGHNFGPNHENMKAMTIAEDRAIANFLTELSHEIPGGLSDVFIVLTGDHGMPPSNLPKERLPSENISEDLVPSLVEEALTKEFGSPKGGKWIQASIEFQIYLNREALKSAGITVSQALKPVRTRLMKERFVDDVFARDDIMKERKVPAGEVGVALDRSLSENSGDLLVVLKPFFYSATDPYTHMTHYSYDRFVPLIFYGKTFKPGTYRQIVHTVDIAPTLSSILHVLPPAQSEGRVLTEILR